MGHDHSMRWPFGFLRARRNVSRGLFPYHDGTRQRWGDPFTIYRKLKSGDVDMGQIGDAVDRQEEPETTQAIELISGAFAVQRWSDESQTGLTDMEILTLPVLLGNYLEGVKKNTSTGST